MARNESTAESSVITESQTTGASLDADFDARWDAWRARGAVHERAVRRKLIVVAPAVMVAAAIAYALLRG